MGFTPAQNLGLLTLRAGVGGVLFAHGAQKLFGWFGGHGIEGSAGAFDQMGFQPGRANAMAAGVAEAGGGTLIALGLATPVAGSVAAGTMIAAASVHAPNGFFAADGGYEYPALLGLSSAALSLTGPGDWSLDAVLGDRLNRPWMAGAGLLASSVLSAVLVQRRRRAVAARQAEPAARAAADSPATPAAASSDPTPHRGSGSSGC
ncbi:DoxX family protein [Pseudonocardia bannensis]|uniref:DoxX family protein n=1 Tax=Pseudonocardia bannensis TaxID=630973 RepID=A0A848DLT3_9PSEU|nr:DoxX family protein [Pseudonocardia bannensis]NMH93672.1 DoxX family protein [Pseudonocardia bannensis]